MFCVTRDLTLDAILLFFKDTEGNRDMFSVTCQHSELTVFDNG